jgi:serine/threonine protein phosphatase PrpC
MSFLNSFKPSYTYKHQEDEYTCIDQLSKQNGAALFAVFDGHGTDDYAACASDTLHKKILESQLFKGGRYQEAIRAGFAAEDRLLMEHMTNKGGSTSTVVVIVGSELYIGHLGDSRAVLAIQDKPLGRVPQTADHDLPVRAQRVSRDHRPDDPDERRRIIEAGGVVVQGRVIGKESAINMSRALGDFDFKLPRNEARADFISSKPYVPEAIKLTPECRFIVLGSDGLWDQIEERTVVYLIDNLWHQGMNPTEIADTITGRLSGSNSYDNVTIIIVFFVWDATKLPHFKHAGAHTNEEIISSHESNILLTAQQ